MKLLRDLPLFADIPEEVLEELTPLLKARSVESGAILCEQGLLGTHIWLIQSGQVRITITDDRGHEQVLGFLNPDPIPRGTREAFPRTPGSRPGRDGSAQRPPLRSGPLSPNAADRRTLGE